MTRLAGAGFESLSLPAVANTGAGDGWAGGTTPAAIDQTFARSGRASAKCVGGATATSYVALNPNVGGGTIFARWWVYLDAYPTATKDIARFVTSGQFQGTLRVTAGGALQLHGTDSIGNRVQVGTDSPDAVPLNAWTRLEILEKPSASLTAFTYEARLNGVSFASTTTGNGQGSAYPTELRLGWVEAPGQAATMWLDDVAVNSDAALSGSFETSWPPAEGRLALLPANRLIARGTWVTDKASATADADIIDALDNVPPIGIADTTASASNHQVRSASTAASDAIEIETISYGRGGIPGPALNETAGGTYQALGDAAARTRVAQGFYLATGVVRLELNLRSVGSPTDDLTVDVQTDSAGAPSGTSVGGATIAAASVTGTAAWVAVELVAPLTPRAKYWLVLTRAGAVDAANHYQCQKSTANAYYDGGVALHNGSAWGVASLADSLMFRLANDVGMSQINALWPLAVTGEAVATGTKTGTVRLTSPAISSTTITYGGDLGAAGTYPTNWRPHGALAATVANGAASMRESPRAQADKTDGTTRVALLCGLYVAVEYTPPSGWLKLTKTADSTLWWGKPVATTTTGYYDNAGTETAVVCRAGDWFLTADPLPAEGVMLTSLATETDANIKANYTPV